MPAPRETRRRGEQFTALEDMIVSPTHLPDLAHTSLELLIDQFTDLVHLVKGGALSSLELARPGGRRTAARTA